MSDGDMWQHFTNPATRVIHFAQEEAKRMGVSIVGTEHILLGLAREGEGVAARVLVRLDAGLGRMRSELHRQMGASESHAAGSARLTLSLRAKTVLENALQEMREINPQLGLQEYVDTEHLLLGLIREGSGSGSTAVSLLEGLGVDVERIRKEVMRDMSAPAHVAADIAAPPPAPPRPPTDVWLSLTEPAFRVLQLATEEAQWQGTNVIGLPHLALGLLRFIEAALSRQGVTIQQARTALAGERSEQGAAMPSLSPQCADALGFAYQAALKEAPAGAPVRIAPAHLARGLLGAAAAFDSPLSRQLAELGIDLERFMAEL